MSKNSDLSYFLDDNSRFDRIRAFPIRPITDAEFRLLFEKITGKPTRYELKINWTAPPFKESRMSRIEFLDFTMNQRRLYVEHFDKDRIYSKFSFLDEYDKIGAPVDKRLNKIKKDRHNLTYPYDDIFKKTFENYYSCGGIASHAYFNGYVGDKRWYSANVIKESDICCKLSAIYWYLTYNGDNENFIRKQFLNEMNNVFKETVKPVYHNSVGDLVTAKLVSIKDSKESINNYILKNVFSCNKRVIEY